MIQYLISRPRRGGKTTKLIEIAYQTGALIVCMDSQRKREILAMAKQIGSLIEEPLTFSEFLKIELSSDIKQVLIDDVDDILQGIIKNPRCRIIGFSVTLGTGD